MLLALLGTSFGWFMTALGAAAVIIKRLGLPEPLFRKVLDFFLGVSGGVMTAASYWSLLAPALDFAEQQGWEEGWAAMPVALGFVSGGALLQLTDLLMSNLHESLEDLSLYKNVATSEGSTTRSQRLRRLLLLIIAITIHNFPEGMAVGVAFGALGSAPGATFGKAVSLAIGIGIQNFPEGMAVSMPLMREGISPLQAFWCALLPPAELPPAPLSSPALASSSGDGGGRPVLQVRPAVRAGGADRGRARRRVCAVLQADAPFHHVPRRWRAALPLPPCRALLLAAARPLTPTGPLPPDPSRRTGLPAQAR